MNVIHYENSLQQTCNITTRILGFLKLLNNILFLLPFQRCRLEHITYKDTCGSLNRLIDFGAHFHTSIICLCKYRLRPAVVMSVQLNARVRLNTRIYDMTRSNTCNIIGIEQYIYVDMHCICEVVCLS